MKRFVLYIIIFSFIFIPVLNSQALNPNQLKKVTGKAGIVFELGEIFIKIKYGDISYTDTDGYGSITEAGVKVSAHDEYSILHFKPIKEVGQYANANLRKVFGDQVGNVGLIQNDIDNPNAEINKNNSKEKLLSENGFLLPISHLSIELSGICTTLTAINLYNKGISQDLTKDYIRKNSLNRSGITAKLPSVETDIGSSTRDIIIFTNKTDKKENKAMNNNKILLTIERGRGKTAILGGTIEITPTFND
jgi:hypothetical protein